MKINFHRVLLGFFEKWDKSPQKKWDKGVMLRWVEENGRFWYNMKHSAVQVLSPS